LNCVSEWQYGTFTIEWQGDWRWGAIAIA